ncbi:hypothetical protein GYMLUDRAFT_628936 [Collybiopsis luxurians FD-317 M1]|nr:hypothetical protein GYMLUDRAFT_628936 [Collybiopsis luxurians FD-317 M1]
MSTTTSLPTASGIPTAALPGIVKLSGPLIVAYILHWGLFGTLSVQTYLYYLAFPVDRPQIKAVVYGIYLLEVVQTLLVTHDAFAIFGYGYGDLESLSNIHFNWFTVAVMSGVVAFIGQAFYAYRIRYLSNSKVVPVLILLLSLSSSIAAFITGAYSYQAGNDLILYQSRKTSIVVGIWCAGAALGDIVIALCMTYYLSRNDSGLSGTHAIVTKFIRLTIETGSITAVVALLNLILFFACPNTGYYGVPALIMPKLYANSVLMVLNARFKIVGGRATYISTFDAHGNLDSRDTYNLHDTHASALHFRACTTSTTSGVEAELGLTESSGTANVMDIQSKGDKHKL